jgi:hypothetical protein
MKNLAVSIVLVFFGFALHAQELEDVIIETYYISDESDATDTDGGFLPEGSVTYRIYLDLAPNTKVETIFGSSNHECRIETTTLFFNNEDRGEITGDLIGDNRLDDNTVALDSYLTVGAASESHFGVLKSEDVDGSIVGGVNNDGGSEEIAGGLLANEDPLAGIPLTTADGLIDGVVSTVQLISDDASVFNVFEDENDGPVFSTTNGAWAVLGGLEGPTAENRVLIAQITTDGDLSFSLNVRVNSVDGSGGPIDYVSGDPVGNEVFFPALNFPLVPVPGCTNPEACNFDPLANEDDDSCLVPVENCSECSGQELVLIDDDGDGVCNADEVNGCVDNMACNFDPAATEDDGTCLLPVENCTECDGEELVIIDSDGDGICDADEIAGCTDAESCNFEPNATDDDGTCLVPEPDCTECLGEELVLIDDDGDGVCNAEEVFGCTDPDAINFNPNATEDDGSCEFTGVGGCTNMQACNFDPAATADDGSCIIPVENCTECNSANDGLELIDSDGDGICDADEVAGCDNPLACNFDPNATDDDGSCIVPVENCTECNSANDGLDLIDSDGDGICDADEVAGCENPVACNFDPNATDDDGSCLIPVPDCFECQGEELVIIDDDGDGVCNAEEILGCTNPEAFNYDPEATEDDGSCEFLSTQNRYSANSSIQVYPNPFKDRFLIKADFDELELNGAELRVYDVLGNFIFGKIISTDSEGQLDEIQFPHSESGIYLLEIQKDGKRFVSRVVKN